MASPKGRLTALQVDLATLFLQRAPGFFLTGGAVLAGWEPAHRTTDDLDLFTDDDAAMAPAEYALRGAASELHATVEAVITSPDFRRFVVRQGSELVKVDLVRDRAPQLLPKVVRDGLSMDSVEEIFVNKICAFVERSEVRDVVDLMALERLPERNLRVERFLDLARRKDGGATAATIAWLLSTLSLPSVLPGGGSSRELAAFIAELEARMLSVAVPVH